LLQPELELKTNGDTDSGFMITTDGSDGVAGGGGGGGGGDLDVFIIIIIT